MEELLPAMNDVFKRAVEDATAVMPRQQRAKHSSTALSETYTAVLMYAKGLEALDEGSLKQSLRKHLLRTLCADLFDLVLAEVCDVQGLDFNPKTEREQIISTLLDEDSRSFALSLSKHLQDTKKTVCCFAFGEIQLPYVSSRICQSFLTVLRKATSSSSGSFEELISVRKGFDCSICPAVRLTRC